MKKKRDADRAKMRADMMKKAKAAKKAPSVEIMDMPEAERKRGEQVAAYQAKKAEEAKQLESAIFNPN